MPRIPLYNKGLGPTQELAAGQLSPRASTAAFTAPGRAFAGFQQTLSKAGKVAADFELAQQKINADTLDTDVKSTLDEEFSKLERQELDDVSLYEEELEKIREKINTKIETAPRINSRLKSTVQNNFDTRFSALSVGGKQVTFERKRTNLANSFIKGLNSNAENARKNPDLAEALNSDSQFIYQNAREAGVENMLPMSSEEYFSNFKSEQIAISLLNTQEKVQNKTLTLAQAQENFNAAEKQIKESSRLNEITFQKEQDLLADLQSVRQNSEVMFLDNSIEVVRFSFPNFDIDTVNTIQSGLQQGKTEFVIKDYQGLDTKISFEGLSQESLDKINDELIRLTSTKRSLERDIIIGLLGEMQKDGAPNEAFEKASDALRDGEEFTYPKKDGSIISFNSSFLKEAVQQELSQFTNNFLEDPEELSQKTIQDFGDKVLSSIGSVSPLESAGNIILGRSDNMSEEQAEEILVLTVQRDAQSNIRKLQVTEDENERAVLLERLNNIQQILTSPINDQQPFEFRTGNIGKTANNTLNVIFDMQIKQFKAIGEKAVNATIKQEVLDGRGANLSLHFSSDKIEKVTQALMKDISIEEKDAETKNRKIINIAQDTGVTHKEWEFTLEQAFRNARNASVSPDSEDFGMITQGLNLFNFLKNYQNVLSDHTDSKQRAFFTELNERVDFEPLEQAILNTRKAIEDPEPSNVSQGLLERAYDKLAKQMDPGFFGGDDPLNEIAVKNLLLQRAQDYLEIGGARNATKALEFAREDILNDFIFIEGHYQQIDDFNKNTTIFTTGIAEAKKMLLEESQNKVTLKVILDPLEEYEENDLRIVKSEFLENYILTDKNGRPLDGVVLDEKGNETIFRRLITITPQQINEFGTQEIQEKRQEEENRIKNAVKLNAQKDKAFNSTGTYEQQQEYLKSAGRYLEILSLEKDEQGNIELIESPSGKIMLKTEKIDPKFGFMERQRESLMSN